MASNPKKAAMPKSSDEALLAAKMSGATVTAAMGAQPGGVYLPGWALLTATKPPLGVVPAQYEGMPTRAEIEAEIERMLKEINAELRALSAEIASFNR